MFHGLHRLDTDSSGYPEAGGVKRHSNHIPEPAPSVRNGGFVYAPFVCFDLPVLIARRVHVGSFLSEGEAGAFTLACSALCVVGAVQVVRPAFVFGKNGSTDAKWYRRSMTSFVTSYLFGESLAIGCAVVTVVMQAGAYVSLRSLQKVPHLVVMNYFC